MTITSRITGLAIIILAFVMAACTPTGGGERIVSTEPQLGAVVPDGKPIERDLAPITEVVTNCAGITSPVIKNPAVAVGSTHVVEWQVGGKVGTGVTIGQGVVPGGVNLQAALDGHVANSITTSAQQSQAWELPADPGMIMEYTIMWREVWQPAYIDVTFMAPESKILRIDVMYRTGVQSEIVGEKATSCNPGQGAVQTQPTSEPELQSTTPIASSPPVIPPSDCQEMRGESITPPPAAPPDGCVLIVEWWVPPDSNNCEILVTLNSPVLSEGAIGAWWYVYPGRPESHIQAFRQKYPHCRVEDLR